MLIDFSMILKWKINSIIKIVLVNSIIWVFLIFLSDFLYLDANDQVIKNNVFFIIYLVNMVLVGVIPFILFTMWLIKNRGKKNPNNFAIAFSFIICYLLVIICWALDEIILAGWLNNSELPFLFWGSLGFMLYGIGSELIYLNKYEKKYEFLATHDELTGAWNRKAALLKLEDLMENNMDKKQPFSLIFIDIDRFKMLNETSGYRIGNQVLKELAHSLEKLFGDDDIICRSGNDEFLVISFGPSTINKNVRNIIDYLFKEFEYPLIIENILIYLSLSIGICFYPADGNDVQEIFKKADLSLNLAKKERSNSVVIFNKVIEDSYSKFVKIEKGLKELLVNGGLDRFNENNYFYLNFQPKVDKNLKILGAEALLRWKYEGQFISPGYFIPIAEKAGLIHPLGLWVLRECCRIYVGWPWFKEHGISFSVNFSPPQLKEPELISQLRSILHDTGMPPEFLEIEITESSLMEVYEEIDVNNILLKMKNLGLEISIDDFGTGHSSFSRIVEFPINILKIDKTMVDPLPHKEKAVTVCTAIISLAHELNIAIVAEGVETREQFDFLIENNCDIIQGYFFSKPLDLESFVELCKKSI